MVKDVALRREENLVSCTVRGFLKHFHSRIPNTNWSKALRWWKSQDQILREDDGVAGKNVITRAKFRKWMQC